MKIMEAGRPAEVLLVEDTEDALFIPRNGFQKASLKLALIQI